MGTNTEYSVSGGIGTGRYFPGGLALHLTPGIGPQVALVVGLLLMSLESASSLWF